MSERHHIRTYNLCRPAVVRPACAVCKPRWLSAVAILLIFGLCASSQNLTFERPAFNNQLALERGRAGVSLVKAHTEEKTLMLCVTTTQFASICPFTSRYHSLSLSRGKWFYEQNGDIYAELRTHTRRRPSPLFLPPIMILSWDPPREKIPHRCMLSSRL